MRQAVHLSLLCSTHSADLLFPSLDSDLTAPTAHLRRKCGNSGSRQSCPTSCGDQNKLKACLSVPWNVHGLCHLGPTSPSSGLLVMIRNLFPGDGMTLHRFPVIPASSDRRQWGSSWCARCSAGKCCSQRHRPAGTSTRTLLFRRLVWGHFFY